MNYIKKYQNLIFILIGVAVVAGLIWLSKSSDNANTANGLSILTAGGSLAVE